MESVLGRIFGFSICSIPWTGVFKNQYSGCFNILGIIFCVIFIHYLYNARNISTRLYRKKEEIGDDLYGLDDDDDQENGHQIDDDISSEKSYKNTEFFKNILTQISGRFWCCWSLYCIST
eukprot:UN30677